VAAAMNDAERRAASGQVSVRTPGGVELRLVEVTEELIASAYRVIANGTLWPLLHGLFDATYRPVLDRRWHEAWEGYRAYNAAFADEIARVADDGATVVVNDYHLALCGSELAKNRPDLRTIHFSHTPFCGPEELDVLPAQIRRELLQGLSAYGTTAFHTHRWARSFERCVADARMPGANVAVIPLGVDAEELLRIADTDEVARSRNDIVANLGGRRLIFRTDRVEPSKNIVRGFLAYEALLEDDKSLLDEVVLSARLYSSRAELPEYIAYRSAIEQVSARINKRFSRAKHAPIELEIADDLDASIASLSVADVLLINPIRDGMNLVAKEGAVLSRTYATLGLSVQAGAYEELGDYALAIEPFDIAGTAQVLRDALALDERERRTRWQNLAEIAGRRPPSVWFGEVVERATTTENRVS
ncbi:MAG: trehalose-6-phosphate synthase, partial [Acidimicrobiales bacterium]